MSFGPFYKILNYQGYNLTLKSFEMHYVYEDYLEYDPSVYPASLLYKTNCEIIQKLGCRVAKKFPAHFNVQIKSLHDAELRKNWLPPVYFICDLDAHQSIGNKHCSSGMIYTWLDEFPLNKTLKEIVSLELKALDWKQFAKDFDY